MQGVEIVKKKRQQFLASTSQGGMVVWQLKDMHERESQVICSHMEERHTNTSQSFYHFYYIVFSSL